MSRFKQCKQRRHRLAAHIGQGVAVIPTAPERERNGGSDYPYRYDSHFYYLTGFTEPEAVLVIVADATKKRGKAERSLLFCREKNPERETWDGFRYGPEAARRRFGFDEAHPIGELDERLPGLLGDQPVVYSFIGSDDAWDRRLHGWLNQVRAQARTGVRAPDGLLDARALLGDMRLVKTADELALMRAAAAISADAHCRAMTRVRPGMREYEVEAELLHEFRRRGAQAPAYPSIVAGGANACVLHYIENRARLNAGDLLLIDAGCELDGYAADITRTFPVNGEFSPFQKDLYQIVLAAQQAAIAKIKPGVRWDRPHRAALAILARGFIDLGLCRGSVGSVLASGDYQRFYMHKTGHWLGLDVHDTGQYKENGKWRKLKPGMTLTVEPGCYIRPADNVPQHYWNTGIRIEDDIVVTESGCDVLTTAVPKTVDAIETLMGRR